MLSIYTDDPLYSPLLLPITLTRLEKSAVTVSPPEVIARVSAAQPVAATLVRLRPAEGRKVARVELEPAQANEWRMTLPRAVHAGNASEAFRYGRYQWLKAIQKSSAR